MFLIEPERGCSRGCHYCVMRRTTNGGMRTVPPERVLSLIPDARPAGGPGGRGGDGPPAHRRAAADAGGFGARGGRVVAAGGPADAGAGGRAPAGRGRRCSPWPRTARPSGCGTWSTASTPRSRSSARRAARGAREWSGSRSTTWWGCRSRRTRTSTSWFASPPSCRASCRWRWGWRRSWPSGTRRWTARRSRASRESRRKLERLRAGPAGQGRGAADLGALGLGGVHAGAVRPRGGAGGDGRLARGGHLRGLEEGLRRPGLHPDAPGTGPGRTARADRVATGGRAYGQGVPAA